MDVGVLLVVCGGHLLSSLALAAGGEMAESLWPVSLPGLRRLVLLRSCGEIIGFTCSPRGGLAPQRIPKTQPSGGGMRSGCSLARCLLPPVPAFGTPMARSSSLQFLASWLLLAHFRGIGLLGKSGCNQRDSSRLSLMMSAPEASPPAFLAFVAAGSQLLGDMGLGTQVGLVGGPAGLGMSPVSPKPQREFSAITILCWLPWWLRW